MNTPDAGRIRVRWYVIPRPDPGVYTLGPYSSSDWDEDPKSLDPDVGEESTTRLPFDDWRDCCPPPWVDPPVNTCAFAKGPQWLIYTAPAVTLSSDVFPTTSWPSIPLTQASACVWRSAVVISAGVSLQWTLTFNADGSASLAARTTVAGPLIRFRFFGSGVAVDPHGPILLPWDSTVPVQAVGPDAIRLKGSGNRHILAEPCVVLITEGGDALITES
jgi:hypothetical protein